MGDTCRNLLDLRSYVNRLSIVEVANVFKVETELSFHTTSPRVSSVILSNGQVMSSTGSDVDDYLVGQTCDEFRCYCSTCWLHAIAFLRVQVVSAPEVHATSFRQAKGMGCSTFNLCDAQLLGEEVRLADFRGVVVDSELALSIVTPCVYVAHLVFAQDDFDARVDSLFRLLLLLLLLLLFLYSRFIRRRFLLDVLLGLLPADFPLQAGVFHDHFFRHLLLDLAKTVVSLFVLLLFG